MATTILQLRGRGGTSTLRTSASGRDEHALLSPPPPRTVEQPQALLHQSELHVYVTRCVLIVQ